MKTEQQHNNFAILAAKLSAKDWLHEFGLSLCGVIALASILAPLLVLHGAHSGVVEKMRRNLLEDPAVLVVIPKGSKGAGFDDAFIEKISLLPQTRYAIGRIRDVAAEIQVQSPKDKRLTLTLDATSKGDPLFDNFRLIPPSSSANNINIALTATAARKLDVKEGEVLRTTLSRRLTNGKWERLPIDLKITAILPPVASAQDGGFVDMQTLLSIQDFRDGFSTPLFNFEGDGASGDKRHYESFRLYAKNIDEVEELEKWFLDNDIEVRTRAKDIATIRKIDSTLGSVISLIAAAGIAGFFAFMASSSEASVRRKWKQIGMLRLTGLNQFPIMIFILCSSLITGISGCGLSFILYCIIAWSIDLMFAVQTGGDAICHLSLAFLFFTFIAVQIIGMLASGRAALNASRILPSTAIRET